MSVLKKTFAVAATVSLVCLYSVGAMATDKLIVKGTDGTTNKVVVSDTSYPITALGDTTTTSTILLQYVGNASYGRYNDSEMRFARNNLGTQNSGFPYANDRLGYFAFGTLSGSTFLQGAGMFAEAAADQTATNHPGNLFFATTLTNQTYPDVKLAILSGGNVGIGTIAPNVKLEVNGGIRLNTTSARPTCSATYRGEIFFYANSTVGGKDGLAVCAKDASENYAWRTLY
jgi:hypothetical protein